MKVVGLTGGIATGKTAAASILSKLGARVINADELAREVLEPGNPGWRETVEAFGAGILREDNTIDRDKLRKIIFQDPLARKKLEAITHPRIRHLAQERIQKLARNGARVIVYEAPLLFENQIHQWLRPVIVVACSTATQRKRLRERDGLTDEQVERHLQAQLPMEEKRRLADFVIENDGDLQNLDAEVRKVWDRISADV